LCLPSFVSSSLCSVLLLFLPPFLSYPILSFQARNVVSASALR
jgi:hypothetical protein